MAEPLLSEIDDRGVATITMYRPDVRNAFDEHQIDRLTHCLKQAADNENVRVVILQSKGKHFCAGADINYMQRMGNNTHQQNIDDASALAELMRVLNSLPKPTIARVQGAAFGGAIGL
nr:enoyl-CoA hydratase/isomerase family protein [Gammaproteobacteria bacterium]